MTFGKTTSFDINPDEPAADEKPAAKSAAKADEDKPAAKSKGSKHDFSANPEVCSKCGLEKQHLGKSDCSQPDAPAA